MLQPVTVGPEESIVTSSGLRIKKKNHYFYRRRGALWTDLYHTPSNRLKFVNHRPDLDKKHEEYVQKRLEKEKRQERFVYAMKRKSREKQLKRFRRRQMLNQTVREARGYSELPKLPRWISNTQDEQHKTVQIKDHRYYNRDGAIWTDPALAKTERLHHFIRPKEIKADSWANKQLQKRRAAELEADNERRQAVRERAIKIRERFRHQMKENEAKRPTTAPVVSKKTRGEESCNTRDRAWTGSALEMSGSDGARQEYKGVRSQKEAIKARKHLSRSPRPYSSPVNRGQFHNVENDENDARGHRERVRPATSMTAQRIRTQSRLYASKPKVLPMTNPNNSSDYSGLLHANTDLMPMLPFLSKGESLAAEFFISDIQNAYTLETRVHENSSARPLTAKPLRSIRSNTPEKNTLASDEAVRTFMEIDDFDSRLDRMELDSGGRRRPSYTLE